MEVVVDVVSNGGGGGGAGGLENLKSPGNTSLMVSPSPLVIQASAAGLPVTAQGYPITVGAGGGGRNRIQVFLLNGGDGCNSNFFNNYICWRWRHLDQVVHLKNLQLVLEGGLAGGSGGGGYGFGTGTGGATGGTGNTPPVSPPQGNNWRITGPGCGPKLMLVEVVVVVELQLQLVQMVIQDAGGWWR